MNWLSWLDRHAGRILGIALVLMALLAVLLLAGCASRSYLEAISDARSGVQAAQQTPDAAARERLYDAVGRRILALTDAIPSLPAPLHSPAEIVAAPDAYCEAAAPAPAYQAPPPPPPSPWERFRHLGDTMIRWGSILFACAGTLALVGWIAGRLGWAGIIWSIVGSPVTSGIARLAASLGGGSALLGTGVVWATTYWWAIVLAALLALAWAAITHRKDLARMLARFKAWRSRA